MHRRHLGAVTLIALFLVVAGSTEALAQRRIGATLKIAFDPSTFRVGNRHDACARCAQVVRLLTQAIHRRVQGGVETLLLEC